jgi:hypothetical protein
MLMSNQKTMAVILLVTLTAIPVAATIGATQIVQAKKSHHQSSDDGDISSSFPPSTTSPSFTPSQPSQSENNENT